VAGCDVIVADGQSVVWASKLLRSPLPERVAGIDLFQHLLVEAERKGLSVFFLGAKADVLAEMVRRMQTWYPKLKIAGSRNGYFTDDEAGAVADEVRASGASLLFLGMTVAEEGEVRRHLRRADGRARRPRRRRVLRRLRRRGAAGSRGPGRRPGSNGCTGRRRSRAGWAGGTCRPTRSSSGS
jgi:hypothetical protein